MENTAETVFRSWRVGEVIGSGTDGRVSFISKEDGNGNVQTSVLKTIFFHDERNETKDFNLVGKVSSPSNSEIREILNDVTGNIDLIMEIDGGKRFVKYEDYEVKPVKGGFVLYIKMEQMRSLENLLTKFSLTEGEAIQIGASICRGLIRCRKFGYVYPNLKPENILFDERGRCKLGDFGSFSCLEPEKASLAYKKSQYYMAPEYVQTDKINTTCDTYALGIVLYMLTNQGRLPFAEPYPQVVTVNGMDNSLNCRLDNVEFSKPSLASEGLFDIILKACAYNPQDRYLNPSQMLADLKNLAEGKPMNKPEYDEVYSNVQPQEEPQYEAQPQPTQPQQQRQQLEELGLPTFDASGLSQPGELSFDDLLASFGSDKPAPKQSTSRRPVPEQTAPKQAAPKPQPVNDIFREEPKADNQYYADDEDYDEPEEKHTSLKDRINIPNIRPRDYARGKKQPGMKPANEKKRFFLGDLPQSRKRNVETKTGLDIKKILIYAVAAILVLILLICSISLHSKNKADETVSTLAPGETVSQIANNDTGDSESESATSSTDATDSADASDSSVADDSTDTSDNTEETSTTSTQISNQ